MDISFLVKQPYFIIILITMFLVNVVLRGFLEYRKSNKKKEKDDK